VGEPLLWLAIGLSGLGTYLWRGLGVLFSGRMRTDSAVFTWVGCVAYAMVFGLATRIVIFPSGLLAETEMWQRLAACAVAMAVYFGVARNLLLGGLTGVAAFALLLGLERMG